MVCGLGCFKIGASVNVNVDQEVCFILCPSRDATKLQNELSELKGLRRTTEKQIKEMQGEPLVGIREDVRMWLNYVDEVGEEVRELLNKPSGGGFNLLRFCCCLCQNYSRGVDVHNKIERVQQLKNQHRDWNGKLVISIRSHESARAKLMKEVRRLGDFRIDLERKVEVKKMDQQVETSKSVTSWMREVDEVVADAEEVREEESEEMMLRIARIGGGVEELMKQYQNFKSGELVTRAELERVEENPWPSLPLVIGLENMVSKILAFLGSDQDQLLGIHGMGGVGKTTLLGELNRRLKKSSSLGFDLVICVEVKKKVDIFRIQEDVGWRLGYSRSSEDGPHLPADVRDRAKLLTRRVSEKKCLLILDDVWEKLDLGMIGFPPVISNDVWEKKCKVVLTTRDERVCVDMDVHQKLRLNVLNAGDSWTLFWGTIGNDDLLNQEEIRSLAKSVVGKCGGLPVVIVTVARAMANKESVVQLWEDARDALDDFPDEIRGMNDVLERLKFSFDNLEEREKSCFLYCAMFPEGEEIPMGELVEYWIGDELVDVDRHCYLIDRFRNRGRSIVTDLQAACLLERGSDDEHVRMHDTVRDMAVWIGKGDGERKIVALAGKGLAEAIIDKAWIGAKMASLMSNGIDKVIVARDMCKDSSLRSLLISRNIRLENLPEDLFGSMVALRVLDLSETSVIKLPKSVCSLRSIRFLNLSQTGIKALPLEIGELTNLKQLDLSYTADLNFVPLAAISCLSNLQSLNLFASSLLTSEQESNLKLQDLDAMLRLNDLGLRIAVDKPSDALAILLNSNRLRGSTRLLEMWRPRAITSADDLSSIGRRLTRLQKLEILHCDQVQGDLALTGEHFQRLERWKADDLPITSIHVTSCLPRLRELDVSACHELRDFACLWRLPSLRRLRLHCCHGITELLPIMAGECSEVALSRALEYVDLRDLPAMVSVARTAVATPSLAELWVYGCPEVAKLPVVPDGGKKVRVVCEEEWWEALDWVGGGGEMKGRFDPSFFDKSWKAVRNSGF